MVLQRLQGAKKGKAPRQRWHSWHSQQCGLCKLQNLKDARETESLSLRQFLSDVFPAFSPRINETLILSATASRYA
jgi:hypothetical protein